MGIKSNKENIYDLTSNCFKNTFVSAPVNTIFWARERKIEPEKPYLMLTLLNDNDIKPTSEQEVGGNINEVTMYRNMVVTFSIFVDGVGADIASNNDLATDMITHIRQQLETIENSQYLYSKGLSIGNISGVRDLSHNVNGGFVYRYEFECNFEYNDTIQIDGVEGKQVNLTTNSNVQQIIQEAEN